MKPLTMIYWLRVMLGIVAGLLSAVSAFFQDANSLYTLVNSITVALAVYLISYYPLKVRFRNAVEKQSKIVFMGIGMYFFAWIAFFVLFYTIFRVMIPI